MMRRVIKQNKIFLSVVVVLFVVFGLVLYVGANLIYEKEADRQHESEVAHLHSAKQTITTFFSEIDHDLLFFSAYLTSPRDSTEFDFRSAPYKNGVEEILHQFMKAHKQYVQLGIIDFSGHEIVRIDKRGDGTIVVVPEADLGDTKYSKCFQEAMKLGRNQIYASQIELSNEQTKTMPSDIPLVMLATPLFNSRNEKTGIMMAHIDFSLCLQLLPENTLVQTQEGNLIYLEPGGKVNFRRSGYTFSRSSDLLKVSERETLHYIFVEFLPGETLVVVIDHKHPSLEAELYRLVWVSVILFAGFLFLVLIIAYINISRSRKLVEAEKAVIYSLVELAEGRDPETGAHLLKTGQYAAVLSRQLRKSKRYRRIITNDFIENIYDAAPLHDIGKVGIPDSILLKESKLTDEEFEQMKQHVSIGKRILQQAIDKFKLEQPFFIMGRNICAYHHEKCNGKGYLEGLKGEEIPLEARIFALCDAYDAIKSKRPYKDELQHEEAIQRIKSDSGEHFAPDIVDAFLECEKEFAEIHENPE